MHAQVLRYLIEVARHKSIRKAGAALNVASSGINQQILKLEGQLGVKIFDRTPDGVELTTSGQLLLEHASDTVQNFEKLRLYIKDIDAMRVGNINVVTMDCATMALLPEILRRFSAKYPDVTMTVREVQVQDVVKVIEDGYADIGLTFTTFARRSVRIVADMPSPVGAIVRSDHPLAGRDDVMIDECLKYQIVKHHNPEGNYIFLDDIGTNADLRYAVYMHTNSMTMARHAVVIGGAVGIYTRHGFEEQLESGILRFIPIRHPALESMFVGLFIPSNRYINKIERKLVDVATAVLRSATDDHHRGNLRSEQS